MAGRIKEQHGGPALTPQRQAVLLAIQGQLAALKFDQFPRSVERLSISAESLQGFEDRPDHKRGQRQRSEQQHRERRDDQAHK